MAKKQYDTSDLSKPGYYIVNPKGAVHECTKEHARMRLKQIGWRMATEEEEAKYHEVHKPVKIKRKTKKDGIKEVTVAGPGQRFDDPIAEVHSNDPDAILEARAKEQLEKAEKEAEKPKKAKKDEKVKEEPEVAQIVPEDGLVISGGEDKE